MDVEWVILADSAQVVGSKLYLLGGGWDTYTVNGAWPADVRFSVALAFKVPWEETNQRQMFELEITDEDGNSKASISSQLEIGRPAGIPPGKEQLAQAAANVAMKFADPGTIVIVTRVNGEEKHHTSFRVVEGPMLPGQRRSQRPSKPQA